ncbi:MAG: hypothetical protein JWN71_2000 [Xanthobacteraceae bacterium]|jgi:hypothetical protein|nr:hypothetical protein [Xanthobacteraceae bacterium]
MSAFHQKSATAAHPTATDVLSAAYQARDMVHDHLTTSLALCDDVLARCEQMKAASRTP